MEKTNASADALVRITNVDDCGKLKELLVYFTARAQARTNTKLSTCSSIQDDDISKKDDKYYDKEVIGTSHTESTKNKRGSNSYELNTFLKREIDIYPS